MRRLLAPAAGVTFCVSVSLAQAQTIYPIDRAEILAGTHFDLKVEFSGLAEPGKVTLTLNGEEHAKYSASPPTSSRARTAKINPP
jgi:hypothetical protein